MASYLLCQRSEKREISRDRDHPEEQYFGKEAYVGRGEAEIKVRDSLASRMTRGYLAYI